MTNAGQLFSMRRFYCHRCDCQVQIEESSMQCRTCQSGFVEELETQDNPPEPARRIRIGIRIGNESNLGRRHNVSFGEGLGFGRQVSSLLEQFIVGWHLFLIKYHLFLYQGQIGHIGGIRLGEPINLNDYAWGANGLDDVISQVPFLFDHLIIKFSASITSRRRCASSIIRRFRKSSARNFQPRAAKTMHRGSELIALFKKTTDLVLGVSLRIRTKH